MEKFIFFFCLIFVIKSSENLQVDHAYRIELAEAVQLAISSIIPHHARSATLILLEHNWQNLNDEFLPQLSSEIPVRIFVHSKLVTIKDLRVRLIVLLIDDFLDFLKIHKKLSRDFVQLNGYFLVVLTNGEILEVQEIFELFWRMQVYNVNVVFAQVDGHVLVKTFMPFNENSCNDIKPKIINEFHHGSFENEDKNFFPDKMKNLFDCPVRVSVCNDAEPGIVVKQLADGSDNVGGGRDYKLIKTLSDRINFKVSFTYTGDSGYLLENGSSSGTLKTLIDNTSDFAVCDCMLKEKRLKFLDATAAYNTEQLIFLVPQGKLLTGFEKLFYPFSNPVWVFILASISIGIITITIIRSRPDNVRDFVFGTNVKTPYLNLFIGCMGGTQSLLPKRNFARFLLMMLLIQALVIRTLYQGSFYKLMQSSKRHKEVETINEMVEEDFMFYVTPGITDMMQDLDLFKNR